MSILEIIIFSLSILATLWLLISWLEARRHYVHGKVYNMNEVVALYTAPLLVFAWIIILLISYFVGINKLHLLYLLPITWPIINILLAKYVREKDEK